MSRRGNGRRINGIFLLDKDKGITSNDALQRVKRLFGAEKAGHTGSLDPLATGVLPICFGQATKFSQFLLDSDKSYETTIKLGVVTDSGDADGVILSQHPVPALNKAEINKKLSTFRGKIKQIPPMFSAIKIDGKPLYKLARKGITIERPERQVEIFKLELLSICDNEIKLFIQCSKGTYIRSLAEDIGTALGCGGHVKELKRLSVGPFSIGKSFSYSSLTLIENDFKRLDSKLLSISSVVSDWPKILVAEHSGKSLRNGRTILIDKVLSLGMVRIFSRELKGVSDFLGVGEVFADGRVVPRKILVK